MYIRMLTQISFRSKQLYLIPDRRKIRNEAVNDAKDSRRIQSGETKVGKRDERRKNESEEDRDEIESVGTSPEEERAKGLAGTIQ